MIFIAGKVGKPHCAGRSPHALEEEICPVCPHRDEADYHCAKHVDAKSQKPRPTDEQIRKQNQEWYAAERQRQGIGIAKENGVAQEVGRLSAEKAIYRRKRLNGDIM